MFGGRRAQPGENTQRVSGARLAGAEEAAVALIGVVREHQGIDVEEVRQVALTRLGRSDNELTGQLLDDVTDDLVDADGPLSWLPGDRSVHVVDLTLGSVFTHRLGGAPSGSARTGGWNRSAAGLERRGDELAHDEQIWINEAQRLLELRIIAQLDDTTAQQAALAALLAVDQPDLDTGSLRRVLIGLRVDEVVGVVADEVLGFDDDAEALRR